MPVRLSSDEGASRRERKSNVGELHRSKSIRLGFVKITWKDRREVCRRLLETTFVLSFKIVLRCVVSERCGSLFESQSERGPRCQQMSRLQRSIH